MIMKTSGQKLKELRIEAGLSVRGMAEAIDMNFGTYNSRETRSKKPYLEMNLAEKIIPILQNKGILADRVMELVGLDNTLTLPILATITSGDPLKSIKVSKTVTPPDYLPNPEHLEAYFMGDNSMNMAGMSKGTVIFARPVWDFHEDYGTETYHGGGSYYIYKARRDGEIIVLVRQHHANPDKPHFAMACSSDQSYLPETVAAGQECDRESGEPPTESDDSLYIYAIVEAAQTDYSQRR